MRLAPGDRVPVDERMDGTSVGLLPFGGGGGGGGGFPKIGFRFRVQGLGFRV